MNNGSSTASNKKCTAGMSVSPGWEGKGVDQRGITH